MNVHPSKAAEAEAPWEADDKDKMKPEQKAPGRQRGGAPIDIKIISTRHRLPIDVIKQMLPCDLVVASALHGVVLADAFRIPSIWLNGYGAKDEERRTNQSPLKYFDYFEGVGRAAESISTLEEAYERLEAYIDAGKQPQPRFSVLDLRSMAHRFVRGVPFSRISAYCGRTVQRPEPQPQPQPSALGWREER